MTDQTNLTGSSQTGVHEEGIDHIKSNVGGSNTSGGLTGGSDSLDSAHGTTGSGLGSGTTGGIEPTQSNTSANSGILGTMKNYLGIGGNTTTDSSTGTGAHDGTSTGLGSSGTTTHDSATSGLGSSGAGLGSNTGLGSSTTGTGSSGTGLGSQASEYLPQGQGPHPTYAGNKYDPNVSGESGTSGATGGSGLTGGNTGLGSSTTGTGSTSSGPLSGDGLSGSEARNAQSDAPTSHHGSSVEQTAAGAATGAAAGSALSGRDRDTEGTRAPSSTATSTAKDPAGEVAPDKLPTDSDVTTGGRPTESADPTTGDRAMSTKEEATEGGDSVREHEQGKSDAQLGSKRVNEDSIPTAGGEKLGQKHWGESKVVPDNPKPQGESNVSSSDGQPDSKTRDNTSANTGGAHPVGHNAAHDKGDGEKEGLVDKIKDKLHMGHKDKAAS